MTQLMETALTRVDIPASISYWPDLTLVTYNQAMEDFSTAYTLQHGFDGDRPHRGAWAGVTEDIVRDKLQASARRFVSVQTMNGYLQLSILPAYAYHPRPELMLATLHRDRTRGQADLDHIRIRTLMMVNEAHDIAEGSLNTAIQQTNGVLQAMREMAQMYSDTITTLIGLPTDETLSEPVDSTTEA